MKETLYLSFHLREILPGVGETCFASGFAGCYRIRVREILGQKALANGFIQLKIRGERELIDPSPSDEKRKVKRGRRVFRCMTRSFALDA